MSSPTPFDGPWEQWLVHLLWAASVRTSMLAEGALNDTPLTLAGLGLLENVNARPGITIAEVSRRAPQTQQALSQIAARLEKLGFIERRLAGTGRGIGLHLTDEGSRARASANDTIEGFEAVLAGALGTERHGRLVALLTEARSIIRELEPARRAVG